jgi:phthiocerol/phenolphthiocerol synthesis type-I polyketide synthase E
MTDIAIIGMAGRFPGAGNVASFWNNLCSGIESVREVSETELLHSGVDASIWGRDNYIRKAAFPEDVELFDPHFFGFTPAEAAIIDPQHRLLLECAYEALEDAGQDPDRYAGSIAVFVGCALNTYLLTHLLSSPDLLQRLDLVQLNLSSSPDFLATRISYKLGLRGISHSVQCACSTSLVAVHLACQSLLSGESDMALAGGAALNFQLRYGYKFVPGGMFSARGQCRAFDNDADGTVFGNGAGIVVLKRLRDALQDHDQIYAVLKGSAVNNDGADKVGYTAPSVVGQARVITEALANAAVPPASIRYIEAHGTGTPLGDPIETEALARVYGTPDDSECLIGSVKTNIGHLDCAAGISGLIKAIHVVKHGLVPPSLHFVRLNSQIALKSTRLHINATLTPWPQDGGPRRAAVSAFGVGGTNAHVILESAPASAHSGPAAPAYLLIHSAATERALNSSVSQIADHLQAQPSADLGDIAFTLATGRRQLSWRQYQLWPSAAEQSGSSDGLGLACPPMQAAAVPPPLTFMFPGQGSQRPHMGRELYSLEPVFRQELNRCLDVLSQYMGRSPESLLLMLQDQSEEAGLLEQTEYCQPLLFAFEYALAKAWISWGVEPSLLIGHSLGEYVAACLADSIALEDALKLTVIRGRLMQNTAPGAMLSLPLGESEARFFVDEEIALAAVNGPAQCVLSGSTQAMDRMHRRLEAEGIYARPLPVQRAFHSSVMDPILPEFLSHLQQIALSPPRVPWQSNLTGNAISGEDAVDPQYWCRQLRSTVRFLDNVTAARSIDGAILLEVGPQNTLQKMANKLPASHRSAALSSLSGPRGEYASLLVAAGEMWSRGTPVDWAAFYNPKGHHRQSLPTYPFERQRCWIPRSASGSVGTPDRQQEAGTPPSEPSLAVGTTIAHRRPQMSRPYVAPSTPTEKRLVLLLEPMIGVSPLGVRDNFFELGADSLQAVTVVHQINESFGCDLVPLNIFEALDIASLAKVIEAALEEPIYLEPLAAESEAEHLSVLPD